MNVVIPGRRGSDEPGIWEMVRGIPDSRFARPGMTTV